MEGLVVRPARPSELPVCRMLLPEACRHSSTGFLLAAVPGPPYIAGAAAFLRFPHGISSVQVHVVPRMRRRGIGSRLLGQIGGENTAVSGWVDILNQPGALEFAAANGFEPCGSVSTVECDAERACAYFDRHSRGRNLLGNESGRFRIMRLGEADVAEVARLWKRHIADYPGYRTEYIELELAGGKFDRSPVLLDRGRVAGFLLLSFDTDLARIPAEAIDPGARNGWTAAALNIAAAAEVRMRAVRKIQFEWRAGTRYTSKLARRLGGAVIRELRQVMRPAAGRAV